MWRSRNWGGRGSDWFHLFYMRRKLWRRFLVVPWPSIFSYYSNLPALLISCVSDATVFLVWMVISPSLPLFFFLFFALISAQILKSGCERFSAQSVLEEKGRRWRQFVSVPFKCMNEYLWLSMAMVRISDVDQRHDDSGRSRLWSKRRRDPERG